MSGTFIVTFRPQCKHAHKWYVNRYVFLTKQSTNDCVFFTYELFFQCDHWIFVIQPTLIQPLYYSSLPLIVVYLYYLSCQNRLLIFTQMLLEINIESFGISFMILLGKSVIETWCIYILSSIEPHTMFCCTFLLLSIVCCKMFYFLSENQIQIWSNLSHHSLLTLIFLCSLQFLLFII